MAQRRQQPPCRCKAALLQHYNTVWRHALVLLLVLGLCQPAHSRPEPTAGGSSQQTQPGWRGLLQWGSTSSPDEILQSYNGSAVLATYPMLNGTGDSLRKLLPAVAGFVNKSGPAEMLNWSQKPHYAIAREAIFLDWRQKELTEPAPALYAGQQLTCAAARHPPVPFHHCHVFVNHEYRVAYIRSPKSASTSIMNWLGQCRYNRTRNHNSTTCMNYTWERYESPQEIAAIWKDYFFFGFIRNPWSRAYSLYKDMTATNHFLHKHGRRCSMEWGRFCRQPFAEFDRLYGEGCSHKEPHYAYWHMMDQYHCMITPTGGWAVDFLGRVESGSEDWKVIVQEMNKRRLPGVPEVPFSALDHKHKVDTPALLQQAGRQQGNGVPAAAAAGAAASSQQQQLLPQHTRLPAHLLQEQQEQQQQQQSHMGRLFRQLWRRVRLATAAANEAAAEAYGVVDDFVAGAASQQNPDANGALGPYSGANEHCVDAVSEWFACDIEKFGYLPPLEATNATGGSNGTTAAGGVAAAANASVAAAAANTTAAGAANVTAAAAANAANVTGAAAGNATASRNATSAGNTTAAPNVTGAGSAAAGQPRAAAAAAAAGQPPPPPPPAAAAAGATKAANASAGAAAGAAQGAGAGTALGSMLGSNAPVQVSQAQV